MGWRKKKKLQSLSSTNKTLGGLGEASPIRIKKKKYLFLTWFVYFFFTIQYSKPTQETLSVSKVCNK